MVMGIVAANPRVHSQMMPIAAHGVQAGKGRASEARTAPEMQDKVLYHTFCPRFLLQATNVCSHA